MPTHILNPVSISRLFAEFWRRHPALFTGTLCLLFTALWQTQHSFLYIPLTFLLIPLCGFRVCLSCILLAIIALPPLVKTEIPIELRTMEGTFYPHSIKEKRTPFGPQWEYQGTFSPQHHVSFPIKLSLPKRSYPEHPNSDYKYHLKGTLKENYRGPILVPFKNERWTPIEPIRFGLSEWRYYAKQKLRNEIQSQFSGDKAARFLEGISTGEFQDTIMSLEFGRFGLQHIMAVSGFHFSVVTSILCWFFFGLLGRRCGAIFLLLSLLIYFLFLGGAPSITRAWVAASLLILGILAREQVKSLNSLGLGLFIVLALEPGAIRSLGFQFSFAVTASILLFVTPFERLLNGILPSRFLHQALFLSRVEKCGYTVLQWIKKGMALSLAVNVCALPLTLYFFGKFPLWALFFNLFFPFMVAIALLFLIIGLCSSFLLEWIGLQIHTFNNAYTEFMLNLAYNFPRKWDVYMRVENISFEILILYLTALFAAGILLEQLKTSCEK